jgi:hypothetical protein
LDAFPEWLDDYENNVYNDIQISGYPYVFLNLIENPRWDELCEFLKLPIPDVPFPNTDKFRESNAQRYSGNQQGDISKKQSGTGLRNVLGSFGVRSRL